MEYYTALKIKEMPTHAKTWMNVENVILSETSQSDRDRYYIIPLMKYLE